MKIFPWKNNKLLILYFVFQLCCYCFYFIYNYTIAIKEGNAQAIISINFAFSIIASFLIFLSIAVVILNIFIKIFRKESYDCFRTILSAIIIIAPIIIAILSTKIIVLWTTF